MWTYPHEKKHGELIITLPDLEAQNEKSNPIRNQPYSHENGAYPILDLTVNYNYDQWSKQCSFRYAGAGVMELNRSRDSKDSPIGNLGFGVVTDDQGNPFVRVEIYDTLGSLLTPTGRIVVAKKTIHTVVFQFGMTKNERLRLGFPVPTSPKPEIEPKSKQETDTLEDVATTLREQTICLATTIDKIRQTRGRMDYRLTKARNQLQEAVDLANERPEPEAKRRKIRTLEYKDIRASTPLMS